MREIFEEKCFGEIIIKLKDLQEHHEGKDCASLYNTYQKEIMYDSLISTLMTGFHMWKITRDSRNKLKANTVHFAKKHTPAI